MGKKHGSGIRAVLLTVLMGCGLILAGCGSSVVTLQEAVQNTLKERDQLSTLLMSSAEKFSEGDCTLGVQGSAAGVSFDVSYAVNAQEQAQLQVKASYSGADLDGALTCDKGELRLTSPSLIGSGMIKCDLTQDITGFLATVGGLDVNSFREIYESAGSAEQSKAMAEQVKELAQEQYGSLKFENADARELEIEGSTQNCAGRKTSVSGETLADWAASYEAVYSEYVGTLQIPGENGDLQEEFAELDGILRSIETVDLEYYVYKKRLASLVVHAPNLFQAELLLPGGSTPTENLQFTVETTQEGEKHSARKEGRTEDGAEICSYYVDDELVMHREYRPESGELVISGEDAELKGAIEGDENGLIVTVSGVEISGQDMGISGTVTLHPEAIIEIPEPEGSVYNLNTMTEQDFYPLMMQLYTSKAFRQIGQ